MKVFFIRTALVMLAAFFTIQVNAQSSRRFSMGLNVGKGVSDRKGNALALGFDIRYQFGKDKQVSFPVTLGFTSIANEDLVTVSGMSYKQQSWNYIPLKVGIKYFLDKEGTGLYGLAELGVFAKSYVPSTQVFFLYSPVIGYTWRNGLDIGAKFEGLKVGRDNGGYVGIRLGYGF